jgi:hypothetical protein
MIDRFITNPTQLTGVLAFSVATIACAIASRRTQGRDRRLWTLLAALNFLFFVEIFAGFRHRIHDLADGLLMTSGLYDERHGPQEMIVMSVGVIAVVFVSLPLLLRRNSTTARLATSITIALFVLFAIEMVSLHAIDAVLYRFIGPVYLIGWMWAAAAIAICLAAI